MLKNFFKYFNPVFAVKTVNSLVKEYKDWKFYSKTVKQMEKDKFFENNNMQLGKNNQIYLGVNLPAEALMQQDEEKEKFELQLVAKEVSKYNEPFFSAGIFEYLETARERVKTEDYYGYIIMFAFRFQNFTFWNLLYAFSYFAVLISLILWVIFSGSGAELIDFFKNIGT